MLNNFKLIVLIFIITIGIYVYKNPIMLFVLYIGVRQIALLYKEFKNINMNKTIFEEKRRNVYEGERLNTIIMTITIVFLLI